MTAGAPPLPADARQPRAGAVPVRTLLLGAALARAVLSGVAVVLAPLLWREHFLSVVLLRPTKEVLLAAGFQVRAGRLALPMILAAVIPLLVLGVWVFYALGRAFASDVRDRDLPGIAGRVLPADRVERMCRVLDGKGARVVFLGRMAVFPSTMMAAAAGVSGMSTRRFLVADGLGAMASALLVLTVGYALGRAHEQGGLWLTVAGGALAAGLLVALGRWLRASGERQDGAGA